jgi:hypothetical protein
MIKTLMAITLSAQGLVACLPGPVACTDEARASVQVTVVDNNGDAPTNAAVTFQPANGQEAPCDSSGEASNEFTCGFEVSGDITIRATADGLQPAQQVVTVGETADGCHVETEQVTITLSP